MPELFAGLSKSLGVLLKKINDDIQSDESVVNTLNAEDIHTFFNGLSAIVGESASESLVLKLLAFPSADAQARAIARRGGSNALLLAVKAGNNDIVNALLSLESAGEQARARDINGSNALMLAVAKGNLGIVNALLSLDSAAEQLTAKDTNGHTAIFIASVFENAAIRERLIAVRDINQS